MVQEIMRERETECVCKIERERDYVCEKDREGDHCSLLSKLIHCKKQKVHHHDD